MRRLLVILLLGFAGCASTQFGTEKSNPAPSSSYAKQRVLKDANLWALTGPGRAYGEVSATSSMVPLADSHSILLHEVYTPGMEIRVGDWVSFDRGDKDNVTHRVEDVTETHVYVSGVNNRHSDGWFPKTAIHTRVAGILFSSR